MKRYFKFLLILMLAASYNCSKDNDSNTTQSQTIDKSANLKATGSSANDILSNSKFTKMDIEIGHVQGFKPTQEAINNFIAFLKERTFKTNIEVSYNELASPGKDSLSIEEVDDLESKNRTVFNKGANLAIYIYFADAPSKDDDADKGLVTLGAAYRNTSLVIYEATIRKLANRSPVISVADVEVATLNHEFGHLFGLVNLGTTPVNDHEDPDAKNHCNVPGCLMQSELEFGSGLMSVMEKRAAKGAATIPDLDSECITDLQANGGR